MCGFFYFCILSFLNAKRIVDANDHESGSIISSVNMQRWPQNDVLCNTHFITKTTPWTETSQHGDATYPTALECLPK